MKILKKLATWALCPIWGPFWILFWIVWTPVRLAKATHNSTNSTWKRVLSGAGIVPTIVVSLATVFGTVVLLGLLLHAWLNPLGPNGTVFLLAEQSVRYMKMELPDIVTILQNYRPDTSTKFYGQKGKITSDPKDMERVEIGEYGTRRKYIRASDINPHFVNALIAIEDESFRTNPGIDWYGILRAFIKTYVLQGRQEGGSTITQQLVKNMTKNSGKTFERKIREAVLARKVREHFSAEQVIEFIANYYEFEGEVFGVEEASKYFFGISQDQMTVGQAALLASLFKGIDKLNPCSNALTPECADEKRKGKKDHCTQTKAEAAEQRRRVVIKYRLTEAGIIKPGEELDEALKPLTYTCRDMRIRSSDGYGPLFTRGEFEEYMGADEINRGYQVETTLMPEVQKAAEDAVGSVVSEVNENFPPDERACRADLSAEIRKKKQHVPVSLVEGAMVVMRRETREVLALVGGTGKGLAKLNRAFQTKRHPGSTKKICTYGATLEAGYGIDTLAMDETVCFKIVGSKDWCPKNHDNAVEDRAVTLYYAFATSKNTVVGVLANQVGPPAINDFCRRAGITTTLTNKLTTSIGGAEDVSLLDLTNVYATVANLGTWMRPGAITRIMNDRGLVVRERPLDSEQVMTATVAFTLLELQRGVVEHPRGTAHRLGKHVKDGIEVRGKTGTTGNYHDAYFCGETPEIVFCVWLGRDSNDMIGKKQGSPLAVTVVDRFLTTIRPLLTPGLTFPMVESVEWRWVTDDGTVTSSATPTASRLGFVRTATVVETSSIASTTVLRHSSTEPANFDPGSESTGQLQTQTSTVETTEDNH